MFKSLTTFDECAAVVFRTVRLVNRIFSPVAHGFIT